MWRLQDETLLINVAVTDRPRFHVRVKPTTRVDRMFQFAVDHFAKEAPWTISMQDIRVIHADTMTTVRMDQTLQEIGAEDGDELLVIPEQRGD